MVQPKIEEIQIGRPQRPRMPKYVAQLKYGQDHADAIASNELPARSNKIVHRRYGEYELSSWPTFASSNSSKHVHSFKSGYEELPWKVVPCHGHRTQIVLSTTDPNCSVTPMNQHKSPASVKRKCVVANRHIPDSCSVYYVEMEGYNLDTASMGLLLLPIKHNVITQNGANHGSSHTVAASHSNNSSQGQPAPSSHNNLGAHMAATNADVAINVGPAADIAGSSSGRNNSGDAQARIYLQNDDAQARFRRAQYIGRLSMLPYTSVPGMISVGPGGLAGAVLASNEGEDEEEDEVGDTNEDTRSEMLDDGDNDEDDIPGDDEVDEDVGVDEDADDDGDDDDDDDDDAFDDDDDDDDDDVDDGEQGFDDGDSIIAASRHSSSANGSSQHKQEMQTRDWFHKMTVTYDYQGNGIFDDPNITYEARGPDLPYYALDLQLKTRTAHEKIAFVTIPELGSLAGQKNCVGMIVDIGGGVIRFTLNGKLVPGETRIDYDEICTSNADGRKLFPYFAFTKGKINVHLGDGSLPNDGFAFDIASYIKQVKHEFMQNKNDEPINPGNQSMLPTKQLIQEYLEYYGYVEALGSKASQTAKQRQKLRGYLEAGEIELAKELISEIRDYDSLCHNAKFALDFAKFVGEARTFKPVAIAASQEERNSNNNNDPSSDTSQPHPELSKILALGKNLIHSYGSDDAKQEAIREASAILVTREPRPPGLTKYYDEAAVARLIEEIFAALSTEGEPPHTLKEYGSKTQELLNKEAANGPSNSMRIGLLREICDGEIWKW